MIKTVNGESTHFIYDLDSRLIAETPAGSNFSQGLEYIYRGKNLLAQADPETEAISFYHTNYLGAAHQLTDASGTMVWEATYLPFGEAVVAAGSTVTNNWRLPGQYFDEESGLYYNYHRYYDPGIGRYLTPDPIGLEGGINLYAYVQNNPVNSIDPYGLTAAAGTGCGLGPGMHPGFWPGNPIHDAAVKSLDSLLRFLFSKEHLTTTMKMAIFLDNPGSWIYLNEKSESKNEENSNITPNEDAPNNDEDLADDIAEHSQKHNPRIPIDGLSELIKDTIGRGEKINLERGRRAYRDPLTGRVVIIDPSRSDKGTSFIPKRPEYFDGLK